MAAKTETIRARVDATLKAQAEKILEELGLSSSEAIRLFYKQVTIQNGLPFDVKIPNPTTRRAMRDVEQGHDLTHYQDTDEMFEKLGL
jgi:DNA-damage-inducible protein J